MKKANHYLRRGTKGIDLICLSHLRWNFVYQRPQHLLSRAARERRVFFFEEPIFHEGPAHLDMQQSKDGPMVAVPHLPHGLSDQAQHQQLRELLDQMIEDQDVNEYLSWYYTPMALKFSRHLRPSLCIYDCMDQLSHFLGASQEIPTLEAELLRRADLVFTGGQSLYESKRDLHHNIHPFPSSVDVPHFQQARAGLADPDDQAPIAGPRFGYVGVIDERIDIALLETLASERPAWQFVMVGPIVKIDPASLPQLPNLHWLGGKSYADLPKYLSSWDIAMLPFAKNDATRYISPTKTPEYLAAGRAVISTSIRDVVCPYGEQGLVSIADSPDTFIQAAEALLGRSESELRRWRQKVDRFLSQLSWDHTFAAMNRRLESSLISKKELAERSHSLLSEEKPASVLLKSQIALAPG